ncbi:TetR/AcrR family transcriptional regulator [Actinoplanes sp. NPDC051494]|uniref:TetR/AcrR family transcriptional regulator n=1 Tax=Actinoplanes sp. NPDC051494 TaxID=3363907 RepID=UPI0037B94CCA
MPTQRPLRADTERTITAILGAAEQLLSGDPAATMEQIAEAAGVARTTVHRRFATREALIDALAVSAVRRVGAAVEDARPDTAPPLVALYQMTVNILGAKAGWGFAMSRASGANPEVARIFGVLMDTCARLFLRARDAGLLRADVDIAWTCRVYHALLHEAAPLSGGKGIDEVATLVVETLLRGAGTARPDRL